MKARKYYRAPWNIENIAFLEQWWPHFGTYHCAEALGLTRRQVKAKADKIGLHMLPKLDRLCLTCRTAFQYARTAGLLCRACHLAHRKEGRRSQILSLEQWIGLAVNTARHRSSSPSDLTTEYMVALWHEQEGRCHYSGLEMRQPEYGSGRRPYSPSLDRIDSKIGYLRGNVVWCCWICNMGKSNVSAEEYVRICTLVASYRKTQECHSSPSKESASLAKT